MAAPKGNQFWNPDYPGGRPRKFKDPEELWTKAKEYFEHCDDNPFTVSEHTTKVNDDILKTTTHKIPYTWEGLYVFLNVSDLKQYRKIKEYYPIITHISNVIYNQKLSGAASGLFNSNIIARELGLKDRQDMTSNDDTINNVDLSKLSDKALKELKDIADNRPTDK